MRTNEEANDIDLAASQVEEAKTTKEVLRDFFNPRHMKFRTYLTILILVLAYLYASAWPIVFWVLLAVAIIVKGLLLYQTIRYHRSLQELAALMADEEDNQIQLDEEKVNHYVELFKLVKRPSIQISFAPQSDKSLPIGCSKYGGRPDVPEGFEWPVDSLGCPLSLLLQIDCGDIAALDEEHILPQTGRLYFFDLISEMDWDNRNNGSRVLYFDQPVTQLRPHEFPENLGKEYRMEEHALVFSHYSTAPNLEELPDGHEDAIDDWNAYYEAFDRFRAEYRVDAGNIGHMLGYADLIQGPIVDDLQENILLLQLDSIENFVEEGERVTQELLFGDCGSIYFYINRNDLKARRFEDITFALQCY